MGISKYSDPQTFLANYALFPYFASNRGLQLNYMFLKIEDDGSNRKCHFSADGYNFIEIHSVGNTDYLTADEVLFFANSQNATYPAGITILSWKES